MVQLVDGIGYSSKAVFMSEGMYGGTDGKSEAVTLPTQDDKLTQGPWALWGKDNKLPLTYADHIENCGVLSAALDAKARIATGKGVQPFTIENILPDGTEELKWVNDAEINEWLEENQLFDTHLDFSFDKNCFHNLS